MIAVSMTRMGSDGTQTVYGGSMENFFLSKISETVQNYRSDTILQTPNESEVGYISKVDLGYPDILHDGHQHFPLALTKSINSCSFTEAEENWLQKYGKNVS